MTADFFGPDMTIRGRKGQIEEVGGVSAFFPKLEKKQETHPPTSEYVLIGFLFSKT